ncbi:MAG: MBL fold metallo-hydrolase [Burkholderiales bacterium]|nr:MBL fold metallo-hydrolase [Burkholderiales bacterium]
MTARGLPDGITVFERGWLSSNNILFVGCEQAALVDTGYATHADQTLALVRRGLAGRPLDLLLNTHLHSDHCGGNAALQREFPAVRTMIPPGQADAVARWDTVALTYATTGQSCERFRFDSLLQPGGDIRLGNAQWQIHAAPGHDPHSVILFEPVSRVLVSADALWQNGFGVVFPELEGTAAFEEVGATLDLIEHLQPRWVIPGHGSVFGSESGELTAALARARGRLESFMKDPGRHTRHAAKVLLKFKLLELQQVPWQDLEEWALQTPYFALMIARYCGNDGARQWLRSLAQELVQSGAARMSGGQISNE